MTSKELLPRFSGIVDELEQINNQIDYDDPLEEYLQTLFDAATGLKTQMQEAAQC